MKGIVAGVANFDAHIPFGQIKFLKRIKE